MPVDQRFCWSAGFGIDLGVWNGRHRSDLVISSGFLVFADQPETLWQGLGQEHGIRSLHSLIL
jgi:hypothetical protein